MAPFLYFTRLLHISITVCLALLLSGPASAITAKDLMDGMNDEMSKGYITGMVDMLSYQQVLAGNRERAVCINNAFYRNDEALTRVVDAMLLFPDKEPVAVLIVVMNKQCGK